MFFKCRDHKNTVDKIDALLRSRDCFTTEQRRGRFHRSPKAFYNSSEMVVSENTKTVFKYLNFPMSGQDASLMAGRCRSRVAGKSTDVAKTRRPTTVCYAHEG